MLEDKVACAIIKLNCMDLCLMQNGALGGTIGFIEFLPSRDPKMPQNIKWEEFP